MRIYILLAVLLLHQTVLDACQDIINVDCENAILINDYEMNVDYCMEGCNKHSTSGYFDKSMEGCAGSPFPTVWYKLNPSQAERFLSITMNSMEVELPVISIYAGACIAPTLIACNQGIEGTTRLRHIEISENQEIMIAVSSANGSLGNFQLCLNIHEDTNVCNTDNELEIRSTSKGSAIYGPYQPAEDVEFCYKVNGFANTSCNFLHAIIPLFGSGWDPASFSAAGMPINITKALVTQGHTTFNTSDPYCEGDAAGNWVWYEEGLVNYNLNGTNPLSLSSGEAIPAGWVFLNSFDPSCFEFDDDCCVNPTADPNLGYGDDDYPRCDQGHTQAWEICFQLTTRDDGNCSALSDCSVGFKTYGDGETGFYTNNSCKSDMINYKDASTLCCEEPEVVLEAESYQICEGEALEISLNSTDSESEFYWFIDDSKQVTLDTSATGIIRVTDLAVGAHLIDVYASNGCRSQSRTIQIEVNERISAEISQLPENACPGDEVTLKVVLDSGEIADLAIEWNDTTNSITESILTSDIDRPYKVFLSNAGCTSELDYQIVYTPLPEIDLMQELQLSCIEEENVLEALIIDAAQDIDIKWFYENELIANALSIPVELAGIYTLQVGDELSECSLTKEVLVIDNPSDLSFQIMGAELIEIQYGEEIDLEVDLLSTPESELAEVLWIHDGSILCESCLSTSAHPISNVTYTLQITDTYGCVETRSISVKLAEPDYNYYVPNIFNPSRSDENGYFQIYHNGSIKLVSQFEIFDIWGNKAFHATDFKPGDQVGKWDGTINNQRAEAGVYVYMYKLILSNGEEIQHTGQITIGN